MDVWSENAFVKLNSTSTEVGELELIFGNICSRENLTKDRYGLKCKTI